MYNIGFYKRKIEEALRTITVHADYTNKMGDFSINKNAEEFYRGLLNLVFDWDLKNANTPETPNYTGVDLLDSQREIAIQITSEKSDKKIIHSIERFKKKALIEGYQTLYVFMFKGKATVSKTKLNTAINKTFVFDEKKHVLDHGDIFKQLADAELDKLEKIYQYLKKCGCFPKTSNFPPKLTLNLPILELKKVIGRNKELEQLRTALLDHQKVVVVNGLGGIGKTTLAQAYLTKYQDEYDHLIWLTQSNGDNFKFDLITAQGLTQNLNIQTEGKDIETLFIETLTKIKNITDKPNL